MKHLRLDPILASLLALCLCCALCSCGAAKYADEVACAEVGEAFMSTVGDGLEYTEYDSAHREYFFGDTEHYDDCCILYSLDTGNINEIGIFHAKSGEDAEEVAEDCREYIRDMQENSRAFIASYAPEELPKLDSAQVRRFGNYVIYTILPDDKADSVLDAVETRLAK